MSLRIRVPKPDVPDSDVRVAGPRVRRAPHRARPSWMARLLLSTCRGASLLFVLQMSACIIPVAPDFQDPPAAQNYFPYFQSAIPEVGSVVVVNPSVTTTVASVVVADPNVGDTLFYQWVTDYPPYDDSVTRTIASNLSIKPSADGEPTHGSIGLEYLQPGATPPAPNITTFTCSTVAQTIQQHRLALIVGDRAFAPTGAGDLTSVEPPGHVIEASWTFDLSCGMGTASP